MLTWLMKRLGAATQQELREHEDLNERQKTLADRRNRELRRGLDVLRTEVRAIVGDGGQQT